MTPNPNPSTELQTVLEQIAINSNCDWEQVRKHPSKQIDLIHTLAVDALYGSSQALPAPGDDHVRDVSKLVPTDAQVREAMQTAWDDFCDDAQAYPGDMRREGRKLFFTAGVWADHTAMHLRHALATVAAANDEGVAELQVLRTAVKNLLPIGNDQLPGDRVIPIYVRMDELRALHVLATSRSQHEGASS